MELNENRNGSWGTILLSVMLLVFSIAKVVRGLNTSLTVQGGFWNYISLFYYPFFLMLLLTKRQIISSKVGGWLFLYSLISLISGVIFFKEVSINSVYSILMVPYSGIVFYCFYSAERSRLAEKLFIATFFVCLGINYYSIIGYRFFSNSRPLATDVYYSLCLLPFVLLCCKNSKGRGVAIILEFLLLFFSGKRTGFIALSIALFLYLAIRIIGKNENTIKRTVHLVITFLFLLILFKSSTWIDRIYNFGIYNRILSIGEDQGSGRVSIYSNMYVAFQDSHFINKLIGHGAYSSKNVVSIMAHNDFLEALYDYGLISALCLVVFYFSLVRKSIHMYMEKSQLTAPLVFSIVVGIFLSMFSFFLTNYTYVTCLVAFWGYCLSLEDNYSCFDISNIETW